MGEFGPLFEAAQGFFAFGRELLLTVAAALSLILIWRRRNVK